MAANHTFFGPSASHGLKIELSPWRSRGHNDYLAGVGFPDAYDTWTEKQQRAYENGRLIAANIAAAGFKAPAWRAGVTRPRGYRDMLRQAGEAIGPSTVLKQMPPKPEWDVPEYEREVTY